MGIKDSYMGATTMVKIASSLLFSANLYSWMAFSTTGWATVDSTNVNYGIWRACSNENPVDACRQFDGAAVDWVIAFQAFAIFGLLLSNAAMLLVILYIFKESCVGNKEVSRSTGIVAISGAIAWLIAVIVFAEKYDELSTAEVDIAYSFGMAIFSLVLSIVGGILMLNTKGSNNVTST